MQCSETHTYPNWIIVVRIQSVLKSNMIQSNLDRHRSIIIIRKNEKCSTSIYLAQRLDYCFFCRLKRKLGLFKKVFMLVALVNHSLCWRLVYTSGAPLITSLVSWGTQPQLSRVHNFKHFPSQALWILKI